MKKILIILLVVVVILSFTGCGLETEAESNIDAKQKEETERLMAEMNNQIGLPDITNFFEKKMAKEIFELRDDSNLITYAYITNLDGKFIYLGTCIGYGLPYSVQYTNPQKLVDADLGEGWGDIAIPQSDPNGLFMPEGLSATWLMLINEQTGDREIIYCEPEIVVTQTKLPRRLCAEWSVSEDY